MSQVLKVKTYTLLDPIPTPLNLPVLLYRLCYELIYGATPSAVGYGTYEPREGSSASTRGRADSGEAVRAPPFSPLMAASSKSVLVGRQIRSSQVQPEMGVPYKPHEMGRRDSVTEDE